MTNSINCINKMTCEKWQQCFADVVEKSPEYANKIWRSNSYSTFEELEKALFNILDSLNPREKMKVINRHRDAVQAIFHRFITFKAEINSGSLVKFSDITQFQQQLYQGIYLLKAYEKSFGFPFIMKPTNINFEYFYLALQHRCNNTREQEIKIAIDEIKKFSSEKLRAIVRKEMELNIYNH